MRQELLGDVRFEIPLNSQVDIPGRQLDIQIYSSELQSIWRCRFGDSDKETKAQRN